MFSSEFRTVKITEAESMQSRLKDACDHIVQSENEGLKIPRAELIGGSGADWTIAQWLDALVADIDGDALPAEIDRFTTLLDLATAKLRDAHNLLSGLERGELRYASTTVICELRDEMRQQCSMLARYHGLYLNILTDLQDRQN